MRSGLGFGLQPAIPGWGFGACVAVCALRLYPSVPGSGVRCGCVLGRAFRPRPATPGWAVGVCVCLRARSACTPPLLAGVCCAGVCAWARVSAAARYSWLGYWGLCVFVCALRWYPVTPGWGVGVPVCFCARSAGTLPLLAAVCGVGLCAWAQVSSAPRHSWLGCWGACVFVCAPRLHPATPGSDARPGCGRFGWGFGCAPPRLAGVVWCVCVFGCALCLYPATPGWGVLVWVGVPGLGSRLRPATPGWGVGLCVYLFTCSACTPPILAWCGRVCFGSGFGCAPPLLSGVLVCVCVCVALRLYPATSGWVVRCVRMCLGSGFSRAPRLLPGVLGCVCLCVRAPLLPRQSSQGCALCVCVLGLRFWLRPATPGLGVRVCVFVCAFPLYPATPGLGVPCGCVCLGSGFGCPPPLMAGLLGCVCFCVRVPLVPRHSWLGCAVWVCVLGLRFWLRPASPGWAVGVCVCSCAHPACTPPLLVGMCGVGVCAWAGVSAATRYAWLGCCGLCVFVCALLLYTATPGWGVRCGCVCFSSGFGCTPPLLAGLLGCVCARVRASLVPRHSWLGCAVWVCALGLGSRLRPAPLGRGVRVGVCLCVRSSRRIL